jgi:ATP-binding cassette subfamily B protein
VQTAIDALRTTSVRPRLLYYGGLIILISAGQGIFRFLMRRTVNVVSRQIEYDLRNDLFAKLMKLSSAFYQENRTGDLYPSGEVHLL